VGYFQSLLSRPLTGPHVLRPPHQLFDPRPDLEPDRAEPPDQHPMDSDAMPTSPGRAFATRSSEEVSSDRPLAGEAPAITIVPERSSGADKAIDPGVSIDTEPGSQVRHSTPVSAMQQAVGNRHQRIEKLAHGEPHRLRLPTGERVTPLDVEVRPAPAAIAAAPPGAPQQPNHVLSDPTRAGNAKGAQASRGQASQPRQASVPLARVPRNEPPEDPVTVEIGRVDVIIDQPQARKQEPRQPLSPLSRGLGWAAGPPTSLR